MPVLPAGKLERIIFLEQRMPLWAANAVSIGLSAPQVAALSALVSQARTNFDASIAARVASKLATQESDFGVRTMTTMASDLIQTIRIHAESTSNPEVYNLANIPPPAAPKPVGPPPQPSEIRHECNPDGSITLKWKGTLSNGAFFKLYRKLTGQSGFQNIGAFAAKTFVDDSVPAGTHQAVYYLIGQRGATQFSLPSEWYTVNFGFQGGESSSAAAGEEDLKIAA